MVERYSGYFALYIIKNGQYDHVASIEDAVQRGLGMLPQQAIFEIGAKGKIEKMGKPVQVYTACQFVILSLLSLTYNSISNMLVLIRLDIWETNPFEI